MWYHSRNRGWLPARAFAGALTRKPIKGVSSTNTHTPNTTPSDSDDTIHNMNMEMLRGSTLNPDPDLQAPKLENYKHKHNIEEPAAKEPRMMESSDFEEQKPPQIQFFSLPSSCRNKWSTTWRGPFGRSGRSNIRGPFSPRF